MYLGVFVDIAVVDQGGLSTAFSVHFILICFISTSFSATSSKNFIWIPVCHQSQAFCRQ